MKKITILFLLIFSISAVTYAQRVPVSVSGHFRFDIEDAGVGVQALIPVYKAFYVAPTVNYFGGNKNNLLTNHKLLTLDHSWNYGLDIHYMVFKANSNSSFSPFIGLEGMSMSFNKWGQSERSTDTDLFLNLGLSGRIFVSNRVFIHPQVKYSAYLTSEYGTFNNALFTFSVGVGYAF